MSDSEEMRELSENDILVIEEESDLFDESEESDLFEDSEDEVEEAKE